jgi:dihydrodiol dehydrogenase / D-xylose 1-dehydrogenase (NADP)
MQRTRWAVLGPGVISGFFARALPRSEHGLLHAVGSSDPARAQAFASEHGAPVAGTYAEVLARDDVDAVYIGTVHTTHAELCVAALEAGKAVLCEKPVTTTAADTRAVLALADRQGLPFLEAYKYRFGPLADELRRIVSNGVIGRPVHVEAAFGGASPTRTGRLFDPDLAGGAILDVGGYPASLAVGLATWAGLVTPGTAPALLAADGLVGDTGVDEWASATFGLGGLVAAVHTSIVHQQAPQVIVRGSAGVLEIPSVWGSRTDSGPEIVVRTTADPRRIALPAVDPMAAEADAVSLALVEGHREVSAMTWAESVLTAEVLEQWRAALD